jgi:hypothetical protein
MDHFDLSFPRKIADYDKMGGKIIVRALKHFVFGRASARWTRERCERFFEDDANLFRVKRELTGNLPGLSAVFPDMMAPVVRVARDGARELRMMRCGFPPPPTGAAGSGRNGAVSCRQRHFDGRR